jgi:hypothetical protein
MTRTVTPESGISRPSGRAPKVPLPRMTVPLMVAIPGDVGEEESLWHETARASEAAEQNAFTAIREIRWGVNIESSLSRISEDSP